MPSNKIQRNWGKRVEGDVRGNIHKEISDF